MRSRKLSPRSVNELVATFELPELSTPDDNQFGALRFVVQVYKLGGQRLYFPRVFRWDKYEVRPAYPRRRGRLLKRATVELLVLDQSEDWTSLRFRSVRAALTGAVARLNAML